MSDNNSESKKLYTLSDVSQRTGISMPTLQRYKKIYQSRIPAEGKGRKQRYPESAMPVFEELKVENAGRRGRPRKDAAAAAAPARRGRKPAAAAPAAAAKAVKAAKPAAKAANAANAAKAAGTTGARRGRKPGRPAAAPAKAPAAVAARRGGRKAAKPVKTAAAGRGRTASGLLTLGQVSEQTGISYPTLVRYVRLFSDRLPSEGSGRSRRFHPEAVDVFRQLRQESGRGGRKPGPKAGAARGRGRAAAAPAGGGDATILGVRLRTLERSYHELEKRFQGFVKSLQKLVK